MNEANTRRARGRPKGSKTPEAEITRPISMRFSPDVLEIIEQGTQWDGQLKARNKTEFVKRAIRFYHQSMSEHQNQDPSRAHHALLTSIMTDQEQSGNPDFVDYIQKSWATSANLQASRSFPIYTRILRAAQYIDFIETKLRAEPYHLTLNEFRILVSLRRNNEKNLSPSSLKDQLLVSPGTITRQVDHLVQLGLVDRRHDSKDRRRVEVSLTTIGSNLIDSILSDSQTDFLAEFSHQLSNEEKYVLEMTLHKLLMIFEDYLNEHFG